MADEVKTPITDEEVESVQGGVGTWQQFAKGSYVNHGNYVTYKVASGDVLSGIAIRFGVTAEQIKKWNPDKIKNIDTIYAGSQLIIYPKVFR